jgi:hypothetical protein
VSRHARTAVIILGAFTAAAIGAFADGINGVAGDLLCLAYGTAAAFTVGWAGGRRDTA